MDKRLTCCPRLLAAVHAGLALRERELEDRHGTPRGEQARMARGTTISSWSVHPSRLVGPERPLRHVATERDPDGEDAPTKLPPYRAPRTHSSSRLACPPRAVSFLTNKSVRATGGHPWAFGASRSPRGSAGECRRSPALRTDPRGWRPSARGGEAPAIGCGSPARSRRPSSAPRHARCRAGACAPRGPG